MACQEPLPTYRGVPVGQPPATGGQGFSSGSGARPFIEEESADNLTALARLLDRTGQFSRRDRHGYPALSTFQLRLLALLQRWEDELVVSEHEAEFQQRIIAGTVVHDPKMQIAKALFGDPDEPENTPIDDEGIFMPSTDEEFQEMLRIFAEDLKE